MDRLKNEPGIVSEALNKIISEEFGTYEYENCNRFLFSNLDVKDIKYLILLIKALRKSGISPKEAAAVLTSSDNLCNRVTKLEETQDAQEHVLSVLMSEVTDMQYRMD